MAGNWYSRQLGGLGQTHRPASHRQSGMRSAMLWYLHGRERIAQGQPPCSACGGAHVTCWLRSDSCPTVFRVLKQLTLGRGPPC